MEDKCNIADGRSVSNDDSVLLIHNRMKKINAVEIVNVDTGFLLIPTRNLWSNLERSVLMVDLLIDYRRFLFFRCEKSTFSFHNHNRDSDQTEPEIVIWYWSCSYTECTDFRSTLCLLFVNNYREDNIQEYRFRACVRTWL